MQNVMVNPLVTMYQTQLEASKRFADAVFAGTRKIDSVVIGATQRVFTEQLNFVQAIATVRDPRTVGATLQSSFFPRPDGAANDQKEIMRIFAEMQNEIGRSLQDYIEQLGANAARTASTATRQMEAVQDQTQTNDAAFNPMTSMFSVWESAFKEVAALAKRNMLAARTSMEDATARTTQAAGSYTDAAAGAAREAASVVDSAASATAHAARSASTASEEAGSEDKRGSSSSSSHGGGKRK